VAEELDQLANDLAHRESGLVLRHAAGGVCFTPTRMPTPISSDSPRRPRPARSRAPRSKPWQ
jgi:hypothetical protein